MCSFKGKFFSVCCWLVTQLCPTFGDPMDCSPSGSSAHGISQARVLEWVAISFSRGIFLTQGLNLHLLHWQMDSLPMRHLRRPYIHYFYIIQRLKKNLDIQECMLFSSHFLHLFLSLWLGRVKSLYPSAGSLKKQESSRKKQLFLLYWLCQSPWLCGSQ